jgi:hypothetical protein
MGKWLACNGTGADQPFAVFRQQTIAGRDITIPFFHHVNVRRRRKRFLSAAFSK